MALKWRDIIMAVANCTFPSYIALFFYDPEGSFLTHVFGFAAYWWLLSEFYLKFLPALVDEPPLSHLKVLNIIHAVNVGPTACYLLFSSAQLRPALASILTLSVTPETFTAADPRATMLIACTTSFFLFDLYRLPIWAVRDPAMIAHHVLSLVMWPVAVHYDFAAVYLLIFIR